MLQSFSFRTVLAVLVAILSVFSCACSKNTQANVKSANDKLTQQPPSTASSPVKQNTPGVIVKPKSDNLSQQQPNSFELALDKATGALTISESAQSPDDWRLVASQYQDAIALMKEIPSSSPYYSMAKDQIADYQRQIKYAQVQATRRLIPAKEPEPEKIVAVLPQLSPAPQPKIQPVAVPQPKIQPQTVSLPPVQAPRPKPDTPPTEVKPKLIVTAPSPQAKKAEPEAISAPITRRIGGTPIIEVTFNGNQQFEMIVDTGASGTVITQDMARELGVVPVTTAKANTANAKSVEFPVGYIDSMAVGKAKVNYVAVAIAGSELETGLLGHDFFNGYDVTIKRDVVEFRPHTGASINSGETRPSIQIYPKPPQTEEPL